MKKFEKFWLKFPFLEDWPGFKKVRIYIIPSATGAGVLFGVVLGIIAGAIYANNLIYLLSFLLFSFFVLIMLLTHQNMRKLSIAEWEVHSGYAGDHANIWIKVSNGGKDPKEYIRVELRVKKQGWRKPTGKSFSVPTLDSTSFRCFLPLEKRGRYFVDRLCLVSNYPFGLFRCWSVFPVKQEFYVYPKPLGHLPLPRQSLVTGKGKAITLGRSPEEFFDLRGYRPGDNLRMIHWMSYARHRQPQIKQMGEESSPLVEINWAKLQMPDVEDRLSQLSAWLKDARLSGLAVSVRGIPLASSFIRSDVDFEKALQHLSTFGEAS